MDRKQIEQEVKKFERELALATDTGLARWIAYHIILLRKELEMLEKK
jgi:hypothetical protein